MEKEITKLFEEHQSGETSRRDFIRKLAVITGSTAAALTLIPILENNSLTATEKAEKLAEVVSKMTTYPAFTGDMKAFEAMPKKGKKFPAVIVIHENRGLVPHIKDVTNRMAAEGFLALAPDALSPVGGTPEDISNVGELFRQLKPEETTKNFVAAVKYLKTHPNSNGKVGCTGFCWGGAMTNQVAVNCENLDAAAPYYGSVPKTEDVPKIKAPILAHYAENDERINAGIPAFEEALKANNKKYQIYKYPGTGHAFNNDSNPERYNAEQAKIAWKRTVDFFKENLK
jgi:carboxymethylenebutenolidase